jgi:hypothetical protein
MQFNITEKVTSNLVDLAAICGITLVKLPAILQATVAVGVGVTLIIKNFYDILKKKEELKLTKLENEKNLAHTKKV